MQLCKCCEIDGAHRLYGCAFARRWLLPGSIAGARFLSADERAALLDEMAKHQPQVDDKSAAPTKQGSTAAEHEQPTCCWGRCDKPQRARRRSLAEDWAAMKVALRCPLVYCSGVWRCLYAMAVYGLQVGGQNVHRVDSGGCRQWYWRRRHRRVALAAAVQAPFCSPALTPHPPLQTPFY